MLFEEAEPRAQEMHARAVDRTDPAVREELTGRAPAAATTTARRLSDVISGDTLPRPYELYDLVNALHAEPPTRTDHERWLADLAAARTPIASAPSAAELVEEQVEEQVEVQPGGPDRRRRWLAIGLGAAVFVGGGTAAGLLLTGTSGAHVHEITEVAGGNAHTWSDYRIAGGTPGTALVTMQGIGVECRVQGFKVDDGNVWWYRLGDVYGGHFYATADAFYNEPVPAGGSLKGTPFFDPKVPVC